MNVVYFIYLFKYIIVKILLFVDMKEMICKMFIFNGFYVIGSCFFVIFLFINEDVICYRLIIIFVIKWFG